MEKMFSSQDYNSFPTKTSIISFILLLLSITICLFLNKWTSIFTWNTLGSNADLGIKYNTLFSNLSLFYYFLIHYSFIHIFYVAILYLIASVFSLYSQNINYKLIFFDLLIVIFLAPFIIWLPVFFISKLLIIFNSHKMYFDLYHKYFLGSSVIGWSFIGLNFQYNKQFKKLNYLVILAFLFPFIYKTIKLNFDYIPDIAHIIGFIIGFLINKLRS